MAINLQAILSLTDRISDPMRKIERQTQQVERAMDKMSRSTVAADRAHINIGNSVSKLTGGLGSLKNTILGVAGAYAALNSAKSIFDATILNAAKFEQAEVTIGAMFDNKKLAKQYTNMLDRFAADSPVMNSQDMYSNSKGFISTTKDINQLEKMWGLVERMSAIDPQQGVEGAVFALRELFSGDAVSMVERFEMPRQIMNEIKKLPLDQQLTKLDEYFNKIGMTTHLIDEMGGTTLGLWAQVREKFQLVLRDMGQPSLEVISNFLTGVLERMEGGDMQRFANVGAKWIQNILTGLTNGITKVYDWVAAVTSSPEWAERSTLSSKVSFVITSLMDKFNEWYENGGKKDVEEITKKLTESLAKLLEDNAPIIGKAALDLGSKLGSSLVKGISDAIADNPLAKALLGGGAGAAIGSIVPGVGTLLGGAVGAAASLAQHYAGEVTGRKGHNGGLKYVPYDGYKATLHKGETVLPRGEAREYRNGKAGGASITVGTIHLHGVAGDLEGAADKLLDIIATKVQAAGGAGA